MARSTLVDPGGERRGECDWHFLQRRHGLIVRCISTLNVKFWAGSLNPTQTGAGNYTMTGGTLNTPNIDTGEVGTSVFHQSGGQVNVGFLGIGDNYFRFANDIPATPGQAAYLLEGNAVLNVDPTIPVGDAGDAFVGLWGGYAVLTVQGSAVMTATKLSVDSYASWCPLGATGEINLHGNGQIILSKVLRLSGNAVASGTLNQDGGTLTVPRIEKGAGTGTYNFTGGTLNVSEIGMDLVNDGGTLNVGGTGAVTNLEFDIAVSNNIALGQPCTSSTNGWGSYPRGNAVDGVFTNFWHSEGEPDAWWQVDLTGGGTTSVHDIVLSARSDGWTDQMSNFWVRVIDDDGSTVLWQDKFITDPSEVLPTGGSLWVKLPSAVDGRYVQVQVDDVSFASPWFSIAEVQVGDVARHDYSQSALGTLGIELDPTNELCDKLVAGALTLAGTLDVTSLGGSFAAGQVFDILDWSSLTGTFDTVNLPTLTGGLSWDTSSLYTTGELTVVPEPSAIALLLMGMLGLLTVARRR